MRPPISIRYVRLSVMLLVTLLLKMPIMENFKCRNDLDGIELMDNIKNLKRVMVRDGICGESANGSEIVVGISYSFYVTFSPFLAPKPNFIQIGWKTQKFGYSSILVGRIGRSKMVVGVYILSPCYFWSINSPHTKFHPNRLEIFAIGRFWLVGPVGQKMAVAT